MSQYESSTSSHKEEQTKNIEHCYLSFSLAFGSPITSMTTLLKTALDLPMNKYKVLALAFIALFLNEGHTAQKKSLQPLCHG